MDTPAPRGPVTRAAHDWLLQRRKVVGVCADAGFAYQSVEILADAAPAAELLARLRTVVAGRYGDPAVSGRRFREPDRADRLALRVRALLGTSEQPPLTVSHASALYMAELARENYHGRTAQQRDTQVFGHSRAVRHFVTVCGDMAFSSISRRDAETVYHWWARRITREHMSPLSANFELHQLERWYSVVVRLIGHPDGPNPFAGLRFRETRSPRPPHLDPNDLVAQVVCDPAHRAGALSSLSGQERAFLYALIETGCSPLELLHLDAEDIRLTERLPHISIKASPERGRMRAAAARRIPLVGVALAALRAYPTGFPDAPQYPYRCRKITHALRKVGVFTDDRHNVRSLRHSFAARLEGSGCDPATVHALLGREGGRWHYGGGGTLAIRHRALAAVALPFHSAAVDFTR